MFISILSFIIGGVDIFAQWSKDTIKADELKGTQSYIAYRFKDFYGCFIYWNDRDDQFRLISYKASFNTHIPSGEYSLGIAGELIKVGLYRNGNLIDSFDMWMDRGGKDGEYNILETRNMGAMFNPIGQKKKVRKILNHLLAPNSYVRIIAETYGDHPNLDIKIPCITNIE